MTNLLGSIRLAGYAFSLIAALVASREETSSLR